MILGGGGREHALAWKLKRDDPTLELLAAPGNPGIGELARCVAVSATDVARVVELATAERVDLVVVGPEAPLAAGVADALRERGIPTFGPSAAAARIETSKRFAKEVMLASGVPTAHASHHTDVESARRAVAALGAPVVIKATGLAAGKGVVVCETVAEAHAAIDRMLVGRALGDAGERVVVEDFLTGEEASFIVMVDGRHVLPLASSQDHKRLGDGDTGPNTGGMGAYSPAPVVTPAVHARIMREVILPTVEGMAADGIPYTGFLYAGVMVDAAGAPRVLEYNCRLGDPETQPIVMRMKSDLVDLALAAVGGTLDRVEAEWDRRAGLGVVLAAAGYPDDPRKGAAIHGLADVTEETHPGCKVFHAGTALDGDDVVVSGGRVLCVSALGDSVRQAQRAAYDAVARIHFDGMQYRTDIGYRAVARKP